jgi:hypothetical protein
VVIRDGGFGAISNPLSGTAIAPLHVEIVV